MSGAQYAHLVGEDFLVQRDRFAQAARHHVSKSQIRLRSKCVNFPLAEDLVLLSKYLPVEGDCFVKVP